MVHYISTILNSCYETIRDEGRHIMLAKVAQPLYKLDLFNILLGFHLSAIPFQLWAVKICSSTIARYRADYREDQRLCLANLESRRVPGVRSTEAQVSEDSYQQNLNISRPRLKSAARHISNTNTHKITQPQARTGAAYRRIPAIELRRGDAIFLLDQETAVARLYLIIPLAGAYNPRHRLVQLSGHAVVVSSPKV
jgi:hypothetical protein